MSDDETGTTPAPQIAIDLALGFHFECEGSFIAQQDAGIVGPSTGALQPLALSAAAIGASLAES